MSERPARKPIERAWRVIEALTGHAADGRRLTDISTAVESIPSTTLRDLQDLEQLGLVSRVPGRDDAWRLTPRIVRVAVGTQQELGRLQQRLDDINRNYLAGTGRLN